jgi:hypothetical protein
VRASKTLISFAVSTSAGPTTPPTRRGPVLNFPAARKLVATPPGPTL